MCFDKSGLQAFQHQIKTFKRTTAKQSIRLFELIFILYLLMQILLVVGTKLELIIMEMAEEIQDRTTVVKGAPIVEPNNKFFWFNRPQWVLLLIHFILFQVKFSGLISISILNKIATKLYLNPVWIGFSESKLIYYFYKLKLCRSCLRWCLVITLL